MKLLVSKLGVLLKLKGITKLNNNKIVQRIKFLVPKASNLTQKPFNNSKTITLSLFKFVSEEQILLRLKANFKRKILPKMLFLFQEKKPIVLVQTAS